MDRIDFNLEIQSWDLGKLVRAHKLCSTQLQIDDERDKAYIMEKEMVAAVIRTSWGNSMGAIDAT